MYILIYINRFRQMHIRIYRYIYILTISSFLPIPLYRSLLYPTLPTLPHPSQPTLFIPHSPISFYRYLIQNPYPHSFTSPYPYSLPPPYTTYLSTSPLPTPLSLNRYLIQDPYPHDSRCGCPICPDCRYQKPCGGMLGDSGSSCDGRYLCEGQGQWRVGLVAQYGDSMVYVWFMSVVYVCRCSV